MVNEKSLANLKRGNKKNTGRKVGSGGKTWAEIIREIGEQPSKVDPTKTNKQLVIEQAYTHAALGNAAILRELMQRSEPLTETSPVTVNNIIRVREIVNDGNK